MSSKSNENSYETWTRPTIMSGTVTTFAEKLVGKGDFPDGKESLGFFEVSASRYGVTIHRCMMTNEKDLGCFNVVLEAALKEHKRLSP